MERTRGIDVEKAGRRPAAEPELCQPKARAAVDLSPRALAFAPLIQAMRGNSSVAAQFKGGPGDGSYRLSQDIANSAPKAKKPTQLQTNSNLSRISPSEGIVQREVVAGTTVVLEGTYPCFRMNGKKYHIDEQDPKHVTCDTESRMHYYFKGSGNDIEDIVGPGKNKKKSKFSELPTPVINFIKNNYDAIVTVKTAGSIEV